METYMFRNLCMFPGVMATTITPSPVDQKTQKLAKLKEIKDWIRELEMLKLLKFRNQKALEVMNAKAGVYVVDHRST